MWAPYLGAMAGVNVPLVAMRHAYIVTERIAGIQNMPNVRDHDASVYLKLQGDTLQVGGYENNPIFWEEVRFRFLKSYKAVFFFKKKHKNCIFGSLMMYMYTDDPFVWLHP